MLSMDDRIENVNNQVEKCICSTGTSRIIFVHQQMVRHQFRWWVATLSSNRQIAEAARVSMTRMCAYEKCCAVSLALIERQLFFFLLS
jgi:hypothetical protein